jgi:crotonobetainyl-CoA:carnitine CoA-transferase CaiB-like acyl-CoA transferase
MTSTVGRALTGVRVLDLTGPKGHYMGRLLSTLGADVIKIEAPEGDPGRRIGPFAGDDPDPNGSLFWWYYNVGKRSLAVDIEQADGAELVRQLSTSAQVVLESFDPGVMQQLGLDYASLCEARGDEGLVMTSLTPFGQDGPRAGWAWSDAVGLALGGPMSSCGYDTIPGSPPIRPTEHHSFHIGGHYGAMGTLLALHHAELTGLGQYVDVSIHEACACTTEVAAPYALFREGPLVRQTGRHAAALATEPWQYPAQDGVQVLLYGLARNDRDWNRLVDWADEQGHVGRLRDPELRDPRKRQLGSGHDVTSQMLEDLATLAASLPGEAVYRGGQEHGAAWGMIRSPDDNLADPHWEDRGFFVSADHGATAGEVTYPGAPFQMSATPWAMERPAPLLGEHTSTILRDELDLSPADLTALCGAGIIA